MTPRDTVPADAACMRENVYIEGALTLAVWAIGLTWMFTSGY